MVRKDFNLYNFSYFFRYFLRFSVCFSLRLLFVAFSVAIAVAFALVVVVVAVAGFGGAEVAGSGIGIGSRVEWSGVEWDVCFGADAAFLSTKMRICEFSLFLCF